MESMNAFLQSYAPDRFEWESPGYRNRHNLLWARQVWARPLPTPRKRAPTVESSCDDAKSLSDMSISLEESSSHSCKSVYHSLSDMSISLSLSNMEKPSVSTHTRSDSSLSDMSISFSTDAFSYVSPDFEDFAANVPAQLHTIQARMTGVNSFDFSLDNSRDFLRDLSFLADSSSKCTGSAALEDDTHCSDIVTWLASLFADVAQSFVDSGDCWRNISWTDICSDESDDCLSIGTKDIFEIEFAPPMVRIPKTTKTVSSSLRSIVMLPEVNYENINPEEYTTSKNVCMWGRRLERIPKVRVSGQTEAVYCFDARKQRQKQKPMRATPSPFSSMVSASHYAPTTPSTPTPTRVFYRALPLHPSFIQNSANANTVARKFSPILGTEVSGATLKVSQGQILLQNVQPVRFDTPASVHSASTSPAMASPSPTSTPPRTPPSYASVSAMALRVPFDPSSRANVNGFVSPGPKISISSRAPYHAGSENTFSPTTLMRESHAPLRF